MKQHFDDAEFNLIINDILNCDEFLKLKDIVHHGHNRFDHSMRVAYRSYKISKKMKLDYYKTTRAALLHDFFFEENVETGVKNRIKNLLNHPKYACNNACKYFELSDMEKDIISTHMFPIGLKTPRYLESWLVDIVDDAVSVCERGRGLSSQLSIASSFIITFILNYLR